jgi:alkanesulfonate monooxygenase SsuD/methylene tetrahydromethanopterin reductase-like flavin-dependent oxidoreductase (luciferase family)
VSATHPPPLTVGISVASYTHLASGRPSDLFREVADIATAVEASGADLLAVPDHFVQMAIGGGHDAPMLEAYTLLGALAARTERCLLGAFVTPATFRPPALLAKTVTTLDVISGGRAVLGLGAGVNAPEHASYGLAFPGIAERMAILESTLQTCRAMFSEPLVELPDPDGAREVRNVPQPLRVPPILLGGGGERYTLPLVARYADICNLPPATDDELAHKLAVLDAELDLAGRPREAVRRTAFLLEPESSRELRDRADTLQKLGFDGVVIAAARATPEAVATWVEVVRQAMG